MKNIFKRKKKKKEVELNKENSSEEKLDIGNKSEESIFEKRIRSFKDLISTDYDFTDPRKAVTGDNLYSKNMYVAFTPNTVNFASTFHPLYNYGDIDVSIFIDPIDNEAAKAELSKLRTNLAVEYLTADGSLNRMDDMQSKVQEAARLREEVRDGLNKIYDVGIHATIYDRDERELNNNADRLREALGQSDLGIRNGAYFQEDIFFSNKPLAEDRFNVKHTFDKRSLACVYPFTTNNISHERGTMIGVNMDDNYKPIFYDNFDPSLANYNIFCFAQSGSGKSSLVKVLAARTSTLDDIQNIAIDIEGEYRNIAETLGGANITLEAKANTIINFFDVSVDMEKDEITGKLIEEINIDGKINSVTNLIMVLARGYVGSNKYYDDITRVIIRNCVAKEYEKLNITKDPDSLYEYREDGISRRVKKEMPTLSSWYRTLEEMAEKNKENETYKPYYDYLLMVMSEFVRIKNGGFTCFDGQTTPDVRLGYDVPFINFDVSRLNEETELPLAQYVISDFIWEQMIKRNEAREGEKPHKIRFILDEAWRVIKYPEALDFVVKMERRARKKNASTCIITQQFDEFYNEDTSAIIKQSFTKLFLRPDRTEVDAIKEVFKLSEGEAAFLRTCDVGEVLMKIGSVSAKAKILIPDFEMDFVQTNQNA